MEKNMAERNRIKLAFFCIIVVIVGFFYFKGCSRSKVENPPPEVSISIDQELPDEEQVMADKDSKLEPAVSKQVAIESIAVVKSDKNQALVVDPETLELEEDLDLIKQQKTEPKSWTSGRVLKTGEVLIHSDVLIGKVPKDKFGTNQKLKVKYPDEWGRLWPSAFIPIGVSEELKKHGPLVKALDYFKEQTAIEWIELQPNQDGITFIKSDNCASYIGRVGGHQPIYLSEKCGFKEICHEILHSLFAVHEHSRSDRDLYMKILWENIERDKWHNFEILPEEAIHGYTGSVFAYDSGSVMMYEPTFFSKNGEPTFEELKREYRGFEGECLGEIDKERLDYLYGS